MQLLGYQTGALTPNKFGVVDNKKKLNEPIV